MVAKEPHNVRKIDVSLNHHFCASCGSQALRAIRKTIGYRRQKYLVSLGGANLISKQEWRFRAACHFKPVDSNACWDNILRDILKGIFFSPGRCVLPWKFCLVSTRDLFLLLCHYHLLLWNAVELYARIRQQVSLAVAVKQSFTFILPTAAFDLSNDLPESHYSERSPDKVQQSGLIANDIQQLWGDLHCVSCRLLTPGIRKLAPKWPVNIRYNAVYMTNHTRWRWYSNYVAWCGFLVLGYVSLHLPSHSKTQSKSAQPSGFIFSTMFKKFKYVLRASNASCGKFLPNA